MSNGRNCAEMQRADRSAQGSGQGRPPRRCGSPRPGTLNWPSTMTSVPPVVPSRVRGTPWRAARSVSAAASPGRDYGPGWWTRRTGRRTHPPGEGDRSQPMPRCSADSASAIASPPSDRSCALVSSPNARRTSSAPRRLLGGQVHQRRGAAEVAVHEGGPHSEPDTSSVVVPRRNTSSAGGLEARRRAIGDVLNDAEHRDHRGRQDRGLAGLVVEADVAAGDRDAELEAGVLEAAAGLGELPHHVRVLGRAEVQAVGDRQRRRSACRDVAVGLGERQLRAGVRVELGEPAVAVGRHRDAEVRLVVDADHAGVGRLREHGVAAHVAVVLVGDPRLVAQVRRRHQREQRRAQLVAGRRSRQYRAASAWSASCHDGRANGRLVRRAVVRHGPRRRRPHARRASRSWAVAVRDLTDHHRLDVPLLADRHERGDVRSGSTTAIIRSCDSLIRISSARASSRAAAPGRARRACHRRRPRPSLGGGAGQPRAAEVLDAATTSAANISRVHSMSSFSMNGSPTWTLGRLAGPSASKVSEASTETPPMPSPPVRAPYRMTSLPTPTLWPGAGPRDAARRRRAR